MKVYMKDNNGHAASPINGTLKGLFFYANPDSTLRTTSYFGDKRFDVGEYPIAVEREICVDTGQQIDQRQVQPLASRLLLQQHSALCDCCYHCKKFA